MQKPDANGFVNITWPSKNIPHGGIFHTRRVEPTPQQQAFLKVLLEESKHDIALRKNPDYMLRKEEVKPEPEIQMPLVRPRTSKRRSLSAIRESGIYDEEPYMPLKRGEDREKLKEKLINMMAYGETPKETLPPMLHIPKTKPKIPTDKEKWNDLMTQIRERAEWLAEMEDLGQGEPHREIIKDQIAERFRALDALGIDSECSSARSGFSTMRSREILTKRSNGSGKSKGSAKSNKSIKSNKSNIHKPTNEHEQALHSAGSQDKPKSTHSSRRGQTKDIVENVSAYNSPLKYSPRRRV